MRYSHVYRKVEVTTMSCAVPRKAAITSGGPKPSRSTSDIAKMNATREKVTITCDQLGCETEVGGDMCVCC